VSEKQKRGKRKENIGTRHRAHGAGLNQLIAHSSQLITNRKGKTVSFGTLKLNNQKLIMA
jgi:hypothetical protein